MLVLMLTSDLNGSICETSIWTVLMLNRSNVYNNKLYKVLLYKKLVLVIYDVLLHINIFKYCGLSTVIHLHLQRFFFYSEAKR